LILVDDKQAVGRQISPITHVTPTIADWFDAHLKGKESANGD
jgi:hypothetical protein